MAAPVPPPLGPNRVPTPAGRATPSGGKAAGPVAPPLGPNAEAPSAGKKKGGGGFLGGALKLGGGALGEAVEFFSAPQQALFKGVRGAGQIATGDVRKGVGTLASAGKSSAMFSVPGLSLLLEDKPITATQALQPYGVKKLPPTLDTTLSVVADPLNVATFGAGSLAKQGLKVAGKEVAEKITQQGLRKGLTAAEKTALREGLVEAATKSGAKNAEKTAARQFKALSARGRGGIGVRIPFTGIGAPIIPGTAVARAGAATGATAAKKAVLGSRPVRALSRGFISLANIKQAKGAKAAEQVGEAQARYRSGAATLAEDWDARRLAAQTDYAATTGKKFNAADDAFVSAAMEGGADAVAAAKAARPELTRVLNTFDAVRKEQAEFQRARGLMLEEDEIRELAVRRKQAPVAARIAARDEELNKLRDTRTVWRNGDTDVPVEVERSLGKGPDGREYVKVRGSNTGIPADEIAYVSGPAPLPPSAAQERAAGKLAERVRRREATVRGETARGERLMESAARTVEGAQTRAAARTGQVIGRARGRLEEAGQLETGLAARQRQTALAAKRAEKAAKAPAAKRAAADEARAEANKLKGIKAAPSRSRVLSDISRAAQRADVANRAETGTTTELLGREARRQQEAVEQAQKRLAAAQTQQQKTLAQFDLKNAQRARRAVDRRIDTLVARNVKDQDTIAKIAKDILDDPNIITDEKYLKRLFTEEGRKALKIVEDEVKRSGGSVSAALNQGSLKMRTLAREYTARQINEAIETIHAGGTVADDALDRAVRGIAQQLEPGQKLLKESATQSLSARGMEAAKAIAAADFVKSLRGIPDDTGQSILLSADDVATLKAAGAALPDDLLEFKIGKLGTFFATKEVKAEIVGALGRLEDPDGLRLVFDKLDTWWRSQVTAALPGGVPFSGRNARTNVMLMWLSGTNVPKYMAEGLRLQRDVGDVYKNFAADVADKGVEAAMRDHLSTRQFKLWDYARKNGIVGDGYYAVDMGGTLGATSRLGVKGAAKEGGKAKRAVRFAFGTQGTLAVKGRAMNNWVEQHARLSQFLADVDRLGDLEAAARRTKDVLFDYSALTPTERKIKRWGMPFYTFARKNVPGQVRRFVESPGRFVLPEKLARATTGDLPEGSPEYQERQGSRLSKVPGLLGMVTKPERPFQAAVSNVEPLFDLASGRGQKGLRGVASNLGGVPGAPAKAVFEQATGTSVFTGYKLPKSAAERQKLALQTGIPSLARAWAVTARFPTATEAQKKKLEGSTLTQILSMAGVQLTPVNEKEMRRQKRLADAAKRAERG